ncbi:hypothetical protein BCI9360_02205 [Bacillus sp. CECT 9360]|nr:hypothetical protein BCI9360_02205 [Bacillus sp. CECT 9360]
MLMFQVEVSIHFAGFVLLDDLDLCSMISPNSNRSSTGEDLFFND